MSILLFDGLPGSGKSYGVVKNVIVPCLKAGRTVITNIPLVAEKLGEDLGAGSVVTLDDSNMDEIMGAEDMHSLYPGAVWVFDEVWRWWPAGLTAARFQQNHADFFRMHRHSVGDDGKSSEIVIVTQDLSDIASCVRVLIERNYHSVKMSAMGAAKRFRIDIHTMKSGKKGDKIRVIFDTYAEPFVSYYRSHTRIASESDITQGDEVSVDNRGSVWKRPIVRIAIFGVVVILPAAIWLGVSSFHSMFSGGVEPHVDDHSVVSVAPVPASSPRENIDLNQIDFDKPTKTNNNQSLKKTPLEPSLPFADSSDYWRLAGFVDGVDGVRRWFLVGNDGRVRQLPPDACEILDGTRQNRCVVDGRPVSEWTGGRVTVSAALTGANPG